MAGNCCTFKNCKNNVLNCRGIIPPFRFFCYPASEKSRCLEWIAKSGNDKLLELDDEKLKTRRVCSAHFLRSQMTNKRLERNAVPMSYTSVEQDEDDPEPVPGSATRDLKEESVDSTLPPGYEAHDVLSPPRGVNVANAAMAGPSNRPGDDDASVSESPARAYFPVPLFGTFPPAEVLEHRRATTEALLLTGIRPQTAVAPSTKTVAAPPPRKGPVAKPVCRLCMKTGTAMVDLFADYQREESLVDKIQAVTGLVMVNGDGLPRQICPLCNGRVLEWFEYKQLCYASDTKFRALALAMERAPPGSKFTLESRKPVPALGRPLIPLPTPLSAGEARGRRPPPILSPDPLAAGKAKGQVPHPNPLPTPLAADEPRVQVPPPTPSLAPLARGGPRSLGPPAKQPWPDPIPPNFKRFKSSRDEIPCYDPFPDSSPELEEPVRVKVECIDEENDADASAAGDPADDASTPGYFASVTEPSGFILGLGGEEPDFKVEVVEHGIGELESSLEPETIMATSETASAPRKRSGQSVGGKVKVTSEGLAVQSGNVCASITKDMLNKGDNPSAKITSRVISHEGNSATPTITSPASSDVGHTGKDLKATAQSESSCEGQRKTSLDPS